MRDESRDSTDLGRTDADEGRPEELLEDLEPEAEGSGAVKGGDASTTPTTNPTRLDPYKSF